MDSRMPGCLGSVKDSSYSHLEPEPGSDTQRLAVGVGGCRKSFVLRNSRATRHVEERETQKNSMQQPTLPSFNLRPR